MKQKLIQYILFFKKLIPEKHHFIYIGFFSFLYSYIYIFINIISFLIHKKEYQKTIQAIDTGSKKIFVFLYTTDFYDIHQRPQHLAHSFSKREDCIVFFMTKNQTKDNVGGIEKISDSLYLVSNYKIINLIPEYELIIVGPSHYMMLKYLENYQNIIYDFPDELDFFPGFTRKHINDSHLKLIFRANLITPSADYLEGLILKDNKNAKTKVVLNGVFPEDFIISNSDRDYIPKEFKTIKKSKKIVGFYGGLGEGRFDFDLLKFLAVEKKEYHFLIIGAGNIDYFNTKYDFNDNTNITFLGRKDYKDLKFFAKNFDVAIIPFMINKLTLGVSPVKSFEYMVQGLPFVSTDLPECRKYINVLIGENYQDFSNKLEEGILLKQDKNYVKKIQEEGKKHTWVSRTDLIINTLYDEKTNR